MKQKFTVVAQLHEKKNLDLIAYVENSRGVYGKAKRETFRTVMCAEKFNKSKYNTHLQKKYGITKRTANSILSDAQGTYKALRELKEYELHQSIQKIGYLDNHLIPKFVEKRKKNAADLEKYPKNAELIRRQRNLRRKIVSKKNKLNRLRQQKANLEYQIETGRFQICFGTKKLLNTNYEKFVEQRDSQMSFVGSKDETAGNQMLQLSFESGKNQFLIQLRKDFGGWKDVPKEDKYVYGSCFFHHPKNKIREILRTGSGPLSYKIIKKNGRYYLHCTFEIISDEKESRTRKECGVIGLDFNKGLIAVAQTNHYGHLVKMKMYPYTFKGGKKTESELYEIANHIMKEALEQEKPVAVEELNFKRTKAKTEAGEGKKYNEMIHSFAYKKFVHIMERVAFRNHVSLIKVNPAWTSYVAKKNYCNSMKLNIHMGASYVIARKGQGYREKVA